MYIDTKDYLVKQTSHFSVVGTGGGCWWLDYPSCHGSSDNVNVSGIEHFVIVQIMKQKLISNFNVTVTLTLTWLATNQGIKLGLHASLLYYGPKTLFDADCMHAHPPYPNLIARIFV